jgi:hypothetical protein
LTHWQLEYCADGLQQTLERVGEGRHVSLSSRLAASLAQRRHQALSIRASLEDRFAPNPAIHDVNDRAEGARLSAFQPRRD